MAKIIDITEKLQKKREQQNLPKEVLDMLDMIETLVNNLDNIRNLVVVGEFGGLEQPSFLYGAFADDVYFLPAAASLINDKFLGYMKNLRDVDVE